MTAPTISDIPTPPSRSDSPSTFNSRANAFLAALATFASEMQAQAEYLDDLAIDAETAVQAALAGSSAAEWVGGTTYARGAKVWSPIDYATYRRKSAGAGATDPSSDSTNWAKITGTGNVKLTATQTIENKTITSPTYEGTPTDDIYTITDGASVDIDPANGSVQIWTLGASRTPTAANFQNGHSVEMRIADGTAYAVTWSSISVQWVDSLTPTLPTSGYAVIELWKAGGVVYGAWAGNVA